MGRGLLSYCFSNPVTTVDRVRITSPETRVELRLISWKDLRHISFSFVLIYFLMSMSSCPVNKSLYIFLYFEIRGFQKKIFLFKSRNQMPFSKFSDRGLHRDHRWREKLGLERDPTHISFTCRSGPSTGSLARSPRKEKSLRNREWIGSLTPSLWVVYRVMGSKDILLSNFLPKWFFKVYKVGCKELSVFFFSFIRQACSEYLLHMEWIRFSKGLASLKKMFRPVFTELTI